MCGLKIRDQFAASICTVKDDQVLIDPTLEELKNCDNSLEIVMIAGTNKIIYFDLQGNLENQGLYEKIFSAALSSAKSIVKLCQNILMKEF